MALFHLFLVQWQEFMGVDGSGGEVDHGPGTWARLVLPTRYWLSRRARRTPGLEVASWLWLGNPNLVWQ